MEVVVRQINNNVDIKVIKEPKFKFVNIKLSFFMNLDYSDIAAYNILLNLLITRNSKYSNINEFNYYLEDNYGMVVSGSYLNRGNVGIFNLTSYAMNSKYALGDNLLLKQVETIHDCLYEPFLTEESLQEVKMIYIQKLKEQYNKKTYILKKKVNEVLGVNNPYGVNMESTMDDINNVTLEKIMEVYNKLLVSDCRIYVCGNVAEDEVCKALEHFNLSNSGNSILDLSYLKSIDKVDIKTYDSNFMQSAISIIYECDINYNDELFYALKLFIEMFNYDLFNIIREKYNFCYYIYALSNNYLNTIEVYSEIESKNLDKVIELIEKIIKTYDTEFDEERFEISKNKILTYIKNSLDTPKDLIELYSGFDFSKTVSSIEELEEKYKNVTIDQVREVSRMISLKMVSILKEATSNG